MKPSQSNCSIVPKTAQVSSGPHGADGMMDESFLEILPKKELNPISNAFIPTTVAMMMSLTGKGYSSVQLLPIMVVSDSKTFTITVTLYAELENTQRVALVKASSRPIVVRGRNPRFYQFRENIPFRQSLFLIETELHYQQVKVHLKHPKAPFLKQRPLHPQSVIHLKFQKLRQRD